MIKRPCQTFIPPNKIHRAAEKDLSSNNAEERKSISNFWTGHNRLRTNSKNFRPKRDDIQSHKQRLSIRNGQISMGSYILLPKS